MWMFYSSCLSVARFEMSMLIMSLNWHCIFKRKLALQSRKYYVLKIFQFHFIFCWFQFCLFILCIHFRLRTIHEVCSKLLVCVWVGEGVADCSGLLLSKCKSKWQFILYSPHELPFCSFIVKYPPIFCVKALYTYRQTWKACFHLLFLHSVPIIVRRKTWASPNSCCSIS